jgi:vacuolar-type H+-ATPase subunit D/Vma8
MTDPIKFTQEELQSISNVQSQYQAVAIQLIQLKISINNTAKYLKELQEKEEELTNEVIGISETEKKLTQEIETKYGRGELDIETGVFTPTE